MAVSIQTAVYGFGDLSGSGFGATFNTERGISYRYRVWGKDSDLDTSNIRALVNLVIALEQGMMGKSLLNAEVFIFPGNTAAESVFYKGNTKSRTLFALTLRLRHLDMDRSIKMHFTHVAVTRMKAQGTDGLYRSKTCLTEYFTHIVEWLLIVS
jgi:hypothetical protein